MAKAASSKKKTAAAPVSKTAVTAYEIQKAKKLVSKSKAAHRFQEAGYLQLAHSATAILNKIARAADGASNNDNRKTIMPRDVEFAAQTVLSGKPTQAETAILPMVKCRDLLKEHGDDKFIYKDAVKVMHGVSTYVICELVRRAVAIVDGAEGGHMLGAEMAKQAEADFMRL